MSVQLYLIRHGQTNANRYYRHSGRIDMPLNSAGIAQAIKCRKVLQHVHFDAAYCSPLTRTRQTADLATYNLVDFPEITVNELLIERDFGSIDGKFAPITARKIWSYDKSFMRSHYGEETLYDLENRAEDFIEILRERHDHQTVVAFTHGGIIAAIHNVTGCYKREGNFFGYCSPQNCSISTLTL